MLSLGLSYSTSITSRTIKRSLVIGAHHRRASECVNGKDSRRLQLSMRKASKDPWPQSLTGQHAACIGRNRTRRQLTRAECMHALLDYPNL
jgi:hypothetical protein